MSLVLAHSGLPGQKVDFDIITYTPAEIGFVGNTYTGAAHPNGMIYFANGDGLLEFDGSYWRNISPTEYSKVLSVIAASDGLLYLGGKNEFGYMKVNPDFTYEYHSLRSQLDTSIKLIECWQIVEFKGSIYFQGYEQILRWDGNEIHVLPVYDSYIFRAGDRLFASDFQGNFGEIVGDEFLKARDRLNIDDDAVYSLNAIGNDEFLLLTAGSGIYKYNAISRTIRYWKTPTGKFLESPGLYHSRKLKDGTFLATTFEHGVVFFDSTGHILEHFELELGLEKGGLREIFFDQYGDIWLCSDFGIVKLKYRERSIFPAPQISIRKLLADGNSIFPARLSKVEFERRPGNISVQYSCPGMSKDDLEFSYFLDGQMDEWSSWSSVPMATFSGLGGGAYTLYIKARSKGDQFFQVKQLTLEMPLIWYLNPFFYLLVTVVLAILIFSIFRVRSFRMRKQNIELEKQIRQRTKEIERQKKKLEKINKELKETNLELDNFVYRSSHDLTAPLKSIRGLIELSRIEKDHRKYLDLMETSLLRLENFIQSVTAYSSNSKQELEIEDVDFKEVLDWVLSDLNFIKGFNEIRIRTDIPADLRLRTDKRKLYIILNNLINNSVKYHNYDQKESYISIGARVENSHTSFWVEDNGLGIKKEHLNKIFEMFFRASEKSTGSGLGLYIVKEAVAKLGGEITAGSIPGKGTEFKVILSDPHEGSIRVNTSASQGAG